MTPADPRLRYAVEVSCIIVARFAERDDADAWEAQQRAAGRVGLRILDRGGPVSERAETGETYRGGITNAPIALGPGHRS